MSREGYGESLSLEDDEKDSKVITKEDVRLSRLIKPSPLQKRLEEQLQKSRKALNGSNGTLLKNGKSSVKNGSLKNNMNSDERPLFQAESDSDEEVTVTHYSKAPNVSVTQNSKNLSDCTQQLLKDGYRLDEISDEEDLDLIPPRSVDDRCQCCGAVTWQGCIIS
ncbi:protein FAM219A-like [Stylophora pistillata]|uniref:protein FAM219A-like n=1 Tax=Stylophora pistillata TaxID=50429 RepID=UPI000C048D90|nr:protein FAM219A-like [Stylophora pistillata]